MSEAKKVEVLSNAPAEEIAYGLLQREEVPSAARLFVESFPARAHSLFGTPAQAEAFYTDYMDLMRLSYGQTFFAARAARQLAGCLLVTMPSRENLRSIFRDGFMFRAATHAASGRYGFSLRLLSRLLGAILGKRGESLGEVLHGVPHIDVVVVDQAYGGKGIATRLMEMAREACSSRFEKIWLAVDVENVAAIRFYEHVGFRIRHSNSSQHAMVWDFAEKPAARLVP